MEQEDWKQLGKVLSSSYKREIMIFLKENELTPKMVSKKTHFSINHVSNILKELKTMGLVECLNEELRKGRIYRLTNQGKMILNRIEKIESNS